MTQEELKKYLRYDPEEGKFYHVQKRRGVRDVTKPVGTVDKDYLRIKLQNQLYRAHRLAWLHEKGYVSDKEVIDHINHDKLDNRIVNLRSVPQSINSKNLSKPKNNTSGYSGVFKDRDKWRSKITVNGKTKYLGTYKTKDEALKARVEAAKKYKFHENHGK